MSRKDTAQRFKDEAPLLLLYLGLVMAGCSAVLWGFESGAEGRAFLFGFLTAGATLYLFLKNRQSATEGPPNPEAERLSRERQRAETECSQWIAKRARLECKRLTRELRRDRGY